MNARRLAELHREQARLAAEQARVAAELAEEYAREAGEPANDTGAGKSRRKPRALTDIDVAKARKALRRVGLRP